MDQAAIMEIPVFMVLLETNQALKKNEDVLLTINGNKVM